jgi:hypothetical protein
MKSCVGLAFGLCSLSSLLVDPKGRGNGGGALSLACHSRWPQVRSTEGEAREVSQGERLKVAPLASLRLPANACCAPHKQFPTP